MTQAEKSIRNMEEAFAQVKRMTGLSKKQRSQIAELIRSAFVNGFNISTQEQAGVTDEIDIIDAAATNQKVQYIVAIAADRDTVNGI